MHKIFDYTSICVFIYLFSFCTATDYCNINSCNRQPHTMCTYTSRVPSEKCTRMYGHVMTDADNKLLLDIHNSLRREVANGQELRGSPGPQPAAAYMPDLEWDEELAEIADRWAYRCLFELDKCRDVDRFAVGQNVALWGKAGDNNIVADDMIKGWYNQVVYFDPNEVENFTSPFNILGRDISQYTQMVWAETRKVGCAVVDFIHYDIYNASYLVCNYGPAGNVIGKPVYQIKK